MAVNTLNGFNPFHREDLGRRAKVSLQRPDPLRPDPLRPDPLSQTDLWPIRHTRDTKINKSVINGIFAFNVGLLLGPNVVVSYYTFYT